MMDWYKSLDIHTRINMKECFDLLLGVSFTELGMLFSLRERLNIFYNKAKMEGII